MRRLKPLHLIDIALCIVVVEPGARINALDRADDLRSEQYVVGRHHFQQQLHAGTMVDARIEKHVVHEFFERRTTQLLRQAAVAPPVIGHRATAMGNDEPQRRKILEQIGLDELHEGRRVAVQIMCARRVKVGVARTTDMNHSRHIELDHALKKRIPVALRQWRIGPVPVGRIRVDVAADKTEFFNAARQLIDAVRQTNARRLRKLANRHDLVGEHLGCAINQIVARF